MSRLKGYTVTLSPKDVATLSALAGPGYDGGFLALASRVDPGCTSCDGEGCDVCDSLDTTYSLTEPEAWAFRENVEADRDAFLACNGSSTLQAALEGLLDIIV